MKFIETQKPVWYYDMSYWSKNAKRFAYVMQIGSDSNQHLYQTGFHHCNDYLCAAGRFSLY